METQSAPDPQPITWKDVLRAIFLPPVDDSRATLPSISMPSLPQIDTVGELHEVATPLPEELATPAVIHYETASIEPMTDVSPARLATVGVGIIVALLVSYLAQSAISHPSGGFGGIVLVVIAGALWLGILMFEIAPPDGGLLRRGPIVTGGGAAQPLVFLENIELTQRAALAALAAALSGATYIYTAGNTFTLLGTIAWVSSVILWMFVVSVRLPQQLISDAIASLEALRRPTLPKLSARLIPLVAFVVIMATAIFFRIYQLDAIPNEMTSDHVEKLLDSYDVSQGIFHVFMTRNGGREAFQFYFVPLIAKLFGTGMSFTSLKIASVLEGLALIPLMIYFGREVIDGETGFFSAGLVAISWWHIMLSRLALRIVLTPLVFTVILIVLIRAIRTGSRKNWVWAGFWLGIGVYSYQALRIAPLVAVAAFIIAVAGPTWQWLRARMQHRLDATTLQTIAWNTISRQMLNLLCAGLIALALFIPMARVWHDFPNELWNRVVNRTTSTEVQLQDTPQSIFVDNYIKALGMFNIKGDSSWFSAVPGAPMFDTIIGALFILGIFAWLVRLRVRRDPVDLFVLVAILIMLLPSALAIAFPIENPSTTRGSGTLPIVFLIAAWPITLIRQRWSAVLGRIPGNALAIILVALVFAGSALGNFNHYFVEYAQSYSHSALNPGEVADAVNNVIGPEASLDGVWLQGWAFWHDYRAIGIEGGDITFSHAIIDPAMLEDYLTNYPDQFQVRPLVFIVHPDDIEALRILETHFPDGAPNLHHSEIEGRDFVLFVIE